MANFGKDSGIARHLVHPPPLLSPAGLSALDFFLRGHSRLIALDFDGTLSRIVPEREAATLLPGAEDLLRRIHRTIPVAILSGRTVEDLRRRFSRNAPFHFVGNHGLEGPCGPPRAPSPEASCAHLRRRLLALQQAGSLDFELEDKGLSLALHVRNCSNPRTTVRTIRRFLRRERPEPLLVPGIEVLNVLPACRQDKGSALRSMLRQNEVDAALAIGDDETDEAMFDPQDPRILGVRIWPLGKACRTRASYFLENADQVMAVLRKIAHSEEICARRFD